MTSAERHEYRAGLSRVRRNVLLDAGKCLNGEKHDKPTRGVRCPWCAAVHRLGIAAVLADPNAPKPPDGYRRAS